MEDGWTGGDRRRIRTVSRSNQPTRIYHEETNGSQPKKPARSRRGVEKIGGYGNANVETSIDSI